LFGSHMPTNIIVVGAAYQTGIIPISAESIENAITVNGVSVQTNIEAFRAGRLAVMDPEWALTTTEQAIRDGDLDIQPEVTSEARVLIERVAEEGELARLLEIRVPELIAYQNVK